MNKILVTGFYGVVKSEDLTSVFGENAFRQDFKPLRVNTYTGKWPVLKGAIGHLAISETDLERLHLQFYKSASRFNVYDGFDLCTVDNRFYQLLYYAQQLLTESRVSAVFFDVPPHATLEVMVYELAHLLGIKTVVCLQNIFPSSFYVMKSIGASDRYIEAPRRYEIPDEYLEYSSEPLDLFYMKNIKKRSGGVFDMVFQNIIKSIHWRPLRRARFGRSPTTFLSDIALYRDWKKASKRRVLTVDELPKKFVYAPLHLQPEATTQAIGGEYYNQAFMVRELRALLPKDIEVIVKENPKQKIYGRGLGFYDMLEVLDGVQLVRDDTPGMALIEKAIATATITGTAGWEALRMKKPVIYFGRPWYSQLYGAFPASSGVAEKIFSFKPDEAMFRDSLKRLSNHMFEGFVNSGYKSNRPELGYEENLIYLREMVTHVLSTEAPE